MSLGEGDMMTGGALLRAAVVLVLLGAAVLAANAAPAGAEDQNGSMKVDGRTRNYLVHLPPSYDPKAPVPLVLVLHGGYGDPENMAQLSQMNKVADANSFIVAYPEGVYKHWNDGRGNTRSEKAGVNDVKFIDMLIERLSKDYAVDAGRVYASGLSNGSLMTNRLGCELTTRFTALAFVVGPMAEPLSKTCKPAKRIPVIGFFGTADPHVPWQGGEVNGGPALGVEATMALWAKFNGCGAAGPKTALPVSVNDGTSVFRTVYQGCPPRVGVELYTVEGGGHTWPPQQPTTKGSGLSSKNVNASEVIWAFWTQYSSGGSREREVTRPRRSTEPASETAPSPAPERRRRR